MSGYPPGSEVRYAAIFQAAGIPLCVIANDGMLVEVNPAMAALFGYPPGDLQGINVDTAAPNGEYVERVRASQDRSPAVVGVRTRLPADTPACQ